MQPEFSLSMLKFFLRARVSHAGLTAVPPDVAAPTGQRRHEARRPAERRMKDAIRKAAGVTNVEFEMAWMGRLWGAEERSKLWGALGHVPADFGVRLTRAGQENISERTEA